MKQLTKNKKKIKEKSKEFYKNNSKNFNKWYSKPENKKWMSEYMKNYYRENKLNLTLYQKERKFIEKGYDKPMKNKVRKTMAGLIDKKIKTILTLESPEFLFSKLLPEKKIIVFERELEIYNFMEINKPKNVSLFLGDISGFKEIDMNIDFIYLDFCGTFEYEKETINDLKEHIKKCKLFAVTFSLRDKREKLGDFQFDLLKKIQDLTEINWRVIYGETYKDGSPMITILMENTSG